MVKDLVVGHDDRRGERESQEDVDNIFIALFDCFNEGVIAIINSR